MSAIFALVPIFAYAIVLRILFKKAPAICVFFSITFIISFLFLFGMLDLLLLGSQMLYYGGVLGFLYLVFKHKDDVLEFLKSLSIVIYIVVSFVYLALMGDSELFFWDEFSHWGIYPKEMFYLNHLYDNNSVSAHKNYLPGMPLWQYFVLTPLSYNEGSLYFAHFLILFGSLLVMYEKLAYHQIKWIAFVFVTQMVIFATFGHWLSSIYVGHVMGSVFAGIILCALADKYKPHELALFIFPLIAMVLIKDIGLYFGLSFIGICLALLITKAVQEENISIFGAINKYKFIILMMLSFFVVMLLVVKSWSIRQENMGVKKEIYSVSGMIKNIASNYANNNQTTNELDDKIHKRFMQVVAYQQLHKEKLSLSYNEFSYSLMGLYTKTIKLSTIGLFVFFVLMCFIAGYINNDKYKRIQISIIGILLLLTGIVYIGILYLVSTVAFGDQGERIPSFVRYANMVSLPLMMVAFSLFLPIFNNTTTNTKPKNTFIAGVGILLVLILITRPYLPPLYSKMSNPFKKQADAIAKNIINQLPKQAKLYVVFPIRNNGSLNNILQYSLVPLSAKVSWYTFGKKSSQEMLDIYKKYDYVWFVKIDKEIFDKNASLLKMKNLNELFTLYKIDKQNNQIAFRPIL